MDTNFSVIAFCDVMTKSDKESIIQAFSSFYHDLTIKHQTKVELVMVETLELFKDLDHFSWIFEIEKNITKVPSDNKAMVNKYFSNASLLLLLSESNVAKYIIEAQSLAIPTICYDTPDNSLYIDQTNGIFLKNKNSREHNINLISKYLKMIYFDPEVLKILKKGALAQHEINNIKGKIKEFNPS
ncbi:MAG: hypothetical protein KA010_02320 [Saprospiraceae bacterium]|nr:hypothetical protein [Saprospiraceae bacterium]